MCLYSAQSFFSVNVNSEAGHLHIFARVLKSGVIFDVDQMMITFTVTNNEIFTVLHQRNVCSHTYVEPKKQGSSERDVFPYVWKLCLIQHSEQNRPSITVPSIAHTVCKIATLTQEMS